MKKILTMLSALTITSSITPLTVSCSKDEVVLDLNEITADMILNFDKSDYTGFKTDEEKTNKLANLENSSIISWINKKINDISEFKLLGLSKSKLEKMVKNKDSEEMVNFMKKSLTVAAFIIHYFAVTVVPNFESDNKKFTVNITLKKWSDDKIMGQDPESVKPIYDSIKGKEKETVNLTINYDSIKAIFDKQNN